MLQASYRELLMGRDPSTTIVTNVPLNSGSQVALAFHATIIEWPCEIVGFQVAASGSSAADALPANNTLARFFLYTSNPDTYLPYYIVEGTDTADIDGSGTFTVNIGANSPYLLTPITGGDYTLAVMLTNPVPIHEPGFYWAAMAHQSVGGGKFYGSTVRGMQAGVQDLKYTGTTVANGSFTTLPKKQNTNSSNVLIASGFPTIDIWLICQRIAQGVPYGG